MTLQPPLVAGPRNPRTAQEGVQVDQLRLIPQETLPSNAEVGALACLMSGVVYRFTANGWKEMGSGGGGGGSQDYYNPAYPSLHTYTEALDYLLYVPLAGSSFTVNPSVMEVGQVVSSVSLVWGWNKTPTAQTLSGVGASYLAPTDAAKTISGLSLTSASTWTLSATDGTATPTQSVTLSFRLRRFWGASVLTAATPGDLPSSELSTSRGQSRTLSATGQYLYFAWPSTYGTPTFAVNGLASTAWAKTTQSFTNAHGHTESYDVWRSTFLQTGTGISVTVS